jgi:hypothetical protein
MNRASISVADDEGEQECHIGGGVQVLSLRHATRSRHWTYPSRE